MRRAALLVALLCAGPVVAQPDIQQASPADARLAPPADTLAPNLPDDGARTDRAWRPFVTLTVDGFANVRGGLKRGGGALEKLAVALAYDGRLGDHPGWSGLLSVQQVAGAKPSADFSGDIQTASNIEAINGIRVYDAWIARTALDGTHGVKFGMMDLNSDFDVQQTAALFLDSSNGIGADLSQTGANGPSIFPDTALAVTGFLHPSDAWTFRAGAFDGVAGDPAHPARFAIDLSARAGALLIAQAEYATGSLRIAGGAWHYTAGFDRLDGGRSRGNSGVFGIVEGPLPIRRAGKSIASGWLRAGVANGRINLLGSYVGGGIVISGPFVARPNDRFGVSVMRAGTGGTSRRLGNAVAETITEITYRWQLSPGVALQPDAQYIRHPGTNPSVRDALLLFLRLSLSVG